MIKRRMGRIWPMASPLRARQPMEGGGGGVGLPCVTAERPWPCGSVRWAAGAAPSTCPVAITAHCVHAVGAGSSMASSGQGFHVEHRCGEGETPGKDGAGGAHRGLRSMARRCKRLRAAAFNGGRGALVVGGDDGVVL
jgi:hypothetical protein